jgi:diguanylate cyclase (GGDEF)-like protein/putative nucleotidyltransferase with HDIG domain
MKISKLSNSLGFKVILSLMVVSIIPLIVYVILNNIMILMNFSKLENESIFQKSQQAINIIDDREQQVGNIAKDYAIWDDAYDKMLQKDYDWYRENVSDWLPGVYGLDLILALNKQGEIIDQYGIKDGNINDLIKDKTLTGILNGQYDKKLDKYPSGLIEYGGQLYMVGACPVLNINYEGNSSGILILGRSITDALLADIENKYSYSISIKFKDKIVSANMDKSKIAQYIDKINGQNSDDPITDMSVIAAREKLMDISGKEIGDLVIVDSRQTFLSTLYLARKNTNIVFIILIAAALVASIKFRKIIVNPIKNFEDQINQMGKDHELKYVELTGTDEIKSLANSFNWMINILNEHKQENKNLKKLSITDDLTGLYNHRYFFELLHRKTSKVSKLSILFCDIDHFKLINDTKGHSVGDILLKEIANILGDTIGENGIVSRYGGEEFVVMLDNSNHDDSYIIAEKIRLRIGNSEVIQQYHTYFPVTLSIGIAAYPQDSLNPDDLVRKADIAMYYAKQNGRNQCQVYDNHLHNLLENNSAEYMKQEMLLNSVYSLAAAIDAKDSYTEKHSEYVTKYALSLAERIHLSDKERWELRIGGLLHDCGKIGIPDEILHKPGALTDEESNTIKTHTLLGSNIIKYIINTPEIESCIRHHHERWDGNGYPEGLSGTDISLYARIICIADAYHAMTSDRPYRKALPQEIAFKELQKNKGIQFDPELVEKFIDAMLPGNLEGLSV